MAKAAAATRRINKALSNKKPTDEQLERTATELNALADVLEQGSPRSKFDDFLTRPHLGEIYEGQFAPIPAEDGDELEFDPFSIGGGYLHPSSVGITFVRESQHSITATCNIDAMFAGPPEMAHGGIIALVIDECMGSLIRMTGRQAFTANLSINYRAPTPVDEPLQFRAWIEEVVGRKTMLRVTCHGPAGLCVEAEGLFIARKDELPETD